MTARVFLRRENALPPFYHVTALSNFARAFDKYRRLYRKGQIPESTYPGEFYVLPPDRLAIGVAKAERLVQRLGIPGDRPLVLKSLLDPALLRPNLRNGLGMIWPSADLPVAETWTVGADGGLGSRQSLEETMAASLHLQGQRFTSFSALRPRSLSFLPVARGCQAACPFCFSEASISADQPGGKPDWPLIDRWIEHAWHSGAERAVITGGGEPTLWPQPSLRELVTRCRRRFGTVVLITNGLRWARMDQRMAADELTAVHKAGLNVLAVSRHHWDEAANATLMGVETATPALLEAMGAHRGTLAGLRLRLVCVLQQGGVASVSDIDAYVRWAVAGGVDEVCFKELYVSTSVESVHHSHDVNRWSEAHQAPLSLVHDWAQGRGWPVALRLPWGAPVYQGLVDGQPLRVAAYTEPSLFWERANGIARSWNVMADGRCYASLEDRASIMAAPIATPALETA
ncbi:radical SAM protein [Nitrospirillum sp. BR 11828]|uniref:radical SAM protein n=1 Tax=Nitrospirillum sp. BR 11828 TaxID=3104325 RepID=UPI002ACAECEA|nr:radical SAM protein [Nitrospirillum sp. BR 11828]MDZ5648563.1 radical SAM protein [Nitrospirillum sp. BR 11828]